MKRQEWQFNYHSSLVAKAAKEKFLHHSRRQEWWEKKQKEVLTKAKKFGLSIDESLAEGYSNNFGRGAKIVVDNKLQTDLAECHTKIQFHRAKKEEYAGWVEVLTNQNKELELNSDDYLFFFGK